MANKYSNEYQDRYVDVPYDNINRNRNDGLKSLSAKVDLAVHGSSLATSDTVYLCKIPAGAMVVDAYLKHTTFAEGVIDIGWQSSANGSVAADNDGFFAAVAISTASDILLASQQNSATAGVLKVFDYEVNVVLVPSTATTNATGTIEFELLYK